MKVINLLFMIILFFNLQVFAENMNHIGNVKSIKGNALIVHDAKQIKAYPGMMLHEGDQILTNSSSAVGIIFVDGTVMTIDENSDLFLNKYVFNPINREYDFDVFLKKGSTVYNSGRLGKLSPDSVKVRTPKATIGIRGTKFLVTVN
jgi:hypothetical protein